jgi:hypothetical protein
LLLKLSVFVQPRNGERFDRVVRRAVEILNGEEIRSAQIGATVNARAIVLIDPEDAPEALAMLERRGYALQ